MMLRICIVYIFWVGMVHGFHFKPPVISDGCGVTKGCYRVPDKCSPDDCTYFLTWNVHKDSISFSFLSKLNSGMGWSGFSVNDRRKMSGGSVVDCIVMPDEKQSIRIQMSYNDGKDNDPLNDRYLGLVNGSLSGRVVDSMLQCNFTRLKVIDPSAKEHDKVKDLTEPYYVIIGQGPVKSDGTKKRHKHNPHMSSNKMSFKENANYGAARSPLVIAHASLMIVAWMLLASIGIVTSRYLQSEGNGKDMCSKPIWFQIHRISMIATLCLVTAAMIIIFDASQWQFLPPRIHPLLGFISFILLVLNPVVAVFRPTPEHRRRVWFRVFHGVIGHGSHILAVFTIFYGTHECSAYMPTWAQWIAAGFCGWRLVADLLLTFTSAAQKERSRHFSPQSQSSEALINDSTDYVTGQDQLLVVKRVIVVLYMIGAAGATSALLYAVNSPIGIVTVDCC